MIISSIDKWIPADFRNKQQIKKCVWHGKKEG